MAAGAAPAPENNKEMKTETEETSQPKPAIGGRIERWLHEIFQGREESAGWRQ